MKLRGLRFESLEQAQAYLDHWEQTWADTRIHGTTKRQVAAMFAEERPALRPLPAERFRYYQFATRPVHINGYVEVAGGYYAPPLTHLTGSLHVQWDERCVRLLDPKTGQLLVEHERTRPGGYRRREQDRPARILPGIAALLGRAHKAGKAIGDLCDAIFARRRDEGTKQIQGVLRLARDYGVPAAEDACRVALELGVIEYHFVKRYLARVRSAMPDLAQVDPLIRELTHYRDLINARTGGTEP